MASPFLAPERERFRRNFRGSNLRALESGPCPGLSFSLVSGWGRHRFLPFPLSWVRPKANGGRPGHVSHPLTTFLPFDSEVTQNPKSCRKEILSAHLSGKPGGLNGSMQHFPEVYSQESENLKFVVGVDLSATLLCSDPTGNSRLGLRSSGSIVVRARLCFRSSRVARDSADHRSRLSHPWLP